MQIIEPIGLSWFRIGTIFLIIIKKLKKISQTYKFRWLGLHLEFVGSMVVFFAGLFVILYRYSIEDSEGALALTYALSLTSTLNWLVIFFF